MDKKIRDIITRIYIKKDFDYFIEKCRVMPEFYGDIPRIAKNFCKRTEFFNQGNDPTAEFIFYFKDYNEGSFTVTYTTKLLISKVSDLYNISHTFEIENIDPDRITPILDNFSDEPYTRSQYELEILLTDFLVKHQLGRLWFVDMNEVVENVNMPEEVIIYGPQMTVENALFKDIFGICESYRTSEQ